MGLGGSKYFEADNMLAFTVWFGAFKIVCTACKFLTFVSTFCYSTNVIFVVLFFVLFLSCWVLHTPYAIPRRVIQVNIIDEVKFNANAKIINVVNVKNNAYEIVEGKAWNYAKRKAECVNEYAT